MTDPSGPSPAHKGGAIARILAVHKREGEVARDRTPVLTRAWDRALRRAGAPFRGLNLVPGAVTFTERTRLAPALEALPAHGLVAALEDRDGQRGLIALSHGVVDALIEVQTTGKVEPRGLPPRPVTLCLAAWTHETGDQEDRDWPERMNYGSAVPDRRQLPLLMPDQACHLLSAVVALGEETPREGQVVLLLPCTGAAQASGPGPRGRTQADPPPLRAQPAEWKEAMDAAMQDAELRLDAVLMRTRRRLSEVERLAPGDLIHFGPAELASVRLETPAGRHVATGRLGQIGGKRALRLVAPVGTTPVSPYAAGGGGPDATGFGAALPAGFSTPTGGGPGTGDPDMPGGFGGPGEGVPLPEPAALPDLPGMDPPAIPVGGFPGAGTDFAAGDLPDLPAPGGLDPLPMGTPAPPDFAPQTAPISFDDLPE
ncbi:MAG: FliM/FliN family flagellar motor switch protein [Roseicyclus sp.]